MLHNIIQMRKITHRCKTQAVRHSTYRKRDITFFVVVLKLNDAKT